MKNFNLDREKTLFLFVDLQDKLLKAISNKEEVLKNAKILSHMAQIMDIDRMVTAQYPKGLGYTNAEIIEPIGETKEIEKKSFSCMLDENFRAELEAKKKSQIVMCGIEAHICVLLTARDLIKAGYEVFIASDAMGSRSEFNYKNALSQFKDMGCVVSNVESIMFDLNSIAGTDEFKKVQKLIM
ncbi:Isochorismatase family protein [Anaerosphaera aminiphila DSM 21120]|uniref:Isochorismatase family protein n=1 Tax=Anaerosphaera aminiphila DSM 21120 TaxID=1120995 RepID=A0A1M5TZL8_9FIRM|nr:isochorismatase family protein [Anaerosphaera aminiphila]SHH56237.1 Isochorismatase family protein [Anaerosphaera aminiphila DSM 21120]